MDFASILPHELSFVIFEYAGGYSVLCTLVCKRWKSLLLHVKFEYSSLLAACVAENDERMYQSTGKGNVRKHINPSVVTAMVEAVSNGRTCVLIRVMNQVTKCRDWIGPVINKAIERNDKVMYKLLVSKHYNADDLFPAVQYAMSVEDWEFVDYCVEYAGIELEECIDLVHCAVTINNAKALQYVMNTYPCIMDWFSGDIVWDDPEHVDPAIIDLIENSIY